MNSIRLRTRRVDRCRRGLRGRFYLPFALVAAPLLLGLPGCVSRAPRADENPPPVGLETKPEGPQLAVLDAVGESGTVAAGVAQKGPILVRFPRSDERPLAVLSFAPIDINDRLGLALNVRNVGREPALIYADLNGDTWVRGYVSVAPGHTDTLYVFARRKKLSAEAVEKFPGMHGIPGGKMSLWAGIEEPIVAQDLRVFVVAPRAETSIEVSRVRPFGSSKLPAAPDFFPFIDRYGQYRHRDWPGKIHDDAELKANIAREDADLGAHPGPADRDRFGGWATGPQLASTGNFRVEKYDGKWWLVDPDGRLFWASGLDMVGTFQSTTRIQGRERFYADPAPGGNFLSRNLQWKYGDNWRDPLNARLLQRFHSWGLNTLGGGADRAIVEQHKMPYTALLNSGGRAVGGIDPDNPAWVEAMRRALTTAAAQLKDDPWCIGFFVDNEIHVSYDPAWWEKYYRQVSAVAKELMPNKLYLGSRLDYHDWPDVEPNRFEIVRLAAKYCDVISFNFYKFTLDDVALPAGVDRPAIIGEFHFGALDRGQFHTGLRSVVDQNHRAEAYRNYVGSAAKNPALVGALWFQCYDESTTGRFDGENYQIGFLDICDTPYVETVNAARSVGYTLYALRSAK
ncbi:MAG TPA: hypothetical protein VHD62_17020 [Opitutaceae bacterium]|nr:hypothetical protein [Opitutaceae bacterium]